MAEKWLRAPPQGALQFCCMQFADRKVQLREPDADAEA